MVAKSSRAETRCVDNLTTPLRAGAHHANESKLLNEFSQLPQCAIKQLKNITRRLLTFLRGLINKGVVSTNSSEYHDSLMVTCIVKIEHM